MIGEGYEQRYIVLANLPSPGLAIVTGAGIPLDWDIRKGYGFSGASVVYTGDNLAEFVVTIQMWTQVQLDEWKAFSQLLKRPPRGALAKAMAIQHPLLDELGIDKVVYRRRSQLTPSPTGLWVVEIQFLQYRKPEPALGRPNGAIPNAPGTVPRAEDILDQKIQQAKKDFNDAKEAAQ